MPHVHTNLARNSLTFVTYPDLFVRVLGVVLDELSVYIV